MRKILLSLVVCLVVAGLVFAQERVEKRTQDTDDITAKQITTSRQRATIEQLRERNNLKELAQERLEKLTKLKNKSLEKIQSLRAEQIERLTAVKADRLAKMARNLNQKNIEKIASLDQRQLDKLAALDRTRLREYAQLTSEELKAKLENITVKRVSAERAFKERIVAKEKIQLAKQNFNQAKEIYEKAKEQIKLHKGLLLKSTTEEDKIMYLKQYLSSAIDTIINRLTLLKEKTNENENIDETIAEEKITEIDIRISNLEELKTKIEAATTLEELKELGKDIAKKWKVIKTNNRVRITMLLRANVQEVFRRSEHLEARLEKALADMEEQGISIEGIDAKVDSFSAKINEARELFKQSLEKFNEAKQTKTEATDEERSAIAKLTQEAQRLAKQANQLLKEAHSILVGIVKDIRDAGGNADEVEEPETEEVEIVEEETEGVSENE